MHNSYQISWFLLLNSNHKVVGLQFVKFDPHWKVQRWHFLRVIWPNESRFQLYLSGGPRVDQPSTCNKNLTKPRDSRMTVVFYRQQGSSGLALASSVRAQPKIYATWQTRLEKYADYYGKYFYNAVKLWPCVYFYSFDQPFAITKKKKCLINLLLVSYHLFLFLASFGWLFIYYWYLLIIVGCLYIFFLIFGVV